MASLSHLEHVARELAKNSSHPDVQALAKIVYQLADEVQSLEKDLKKVERQAKQAEHRADQAYKESRR